MPINLLNILPRWVKGTPPARVPFFDFCRIVRNILETATGIERGTGAGARDGLGWHFGSRQTFTDADLVDVEVLVPGTSWDFSGHQIQFVKKTIKVLKEPAAAENSDTVTFTSFQNDA